MKLRQFGSCEILKYNSPKGEKGRRKSLLREEGKSLLMEEEKGLWIFNSPKGERKVVFVSYPKGEKGRQEKTYMS